MIRRLTLAALAGLFCAATLVGTASAFTRAQAICVKNARLKAKDDLASNRDQIRANLNNQIAVCLNDTTGCITNPTTGCVVKLSNCLAPFNTQRDACRATCSATNKTETNACRDSANPVQCVSLAQLHLFNCSQDCVASVQDGVIECNGQFNDCLQICAQ